MLMFSAFTAGFYPADEKDIYVAAGTWPVDAIEMSEAEVSEFWCVQAPDGKLLGADAGGRPAWVDIPAPSVEELTSRAVALMNQYISAATVAIAPLQDAVDLDIATDADTANLKLWKQYRVAINRVSEQPGYPATIGWPTPPV
ncbi:tail fiber assembly protein [Pseudomonas gingeri]|uniref:tail fiber assembly protein n=1 Tax=Pseudomonas gingeri TaxID=117681 RepID=UPI0015A3AFB8|nr:tail fiber assembly protein [Pseudomonas gingeri]NWA23732.1 tail fiber assembly protein [Pseudomonas gingeri]NWD68164.1 tail fiber assembly protein [Pseudomonas gingeri]